MAGHSKIDPTARRSAVLAGQLLDTLGAPAAATIALDDHAWAETLLGLQARRPVARFVSAAPIMRPLRLIKSEDELAIMRRAGAITEAAYRDTLPRLRHGIGMDVHEPPFLTSGDATVLRPGMCFTVEPSIFMPHRLGCRVEDVVVVREGAGEPLTSGFQELLMIE